ncbi:hypothetical protein [Paraburkholderia phytofirmans]|uniref:Guanylate cyclase domain-containing protein n=1 Tax=Paraburkholderia phytofirmans TaxID=261302 RepID=A0ABW9BI43_9BURK
MDSSPYTNRVVAFIDILGFKELILRDRESEVFAALKLAKESEAGQFHNAPKMRLTAFSDSIVISDEVGDGFGYVRLLHFTSYLVWQLLEMGVLTRGGIGHGRLHHENGIVFGPALIEAYELESKQAIYPRILVPEGVRDAHIGWEVATRGDSARAPADSIFRRDFDGNLHLHILSPWAHANIYSKKPHTPGGGTGYSGQEILGARAACLVGALKRNQPPAAHASAWTKHRWFQNYLHETLRIYGLPAQLTD